MRGWRAWAGLAGATLAAPLCAAGLTGAVETTVVRPGAVAKVDDLRFGNLFAGAAAGRVTISAAGVRTGTGGVTLAGGDVGAASFVAAGAANRRITIQLPNNVALARAGGGATMTASNFTRSGPNGNGNIRLAADGTYSFTVGARLNVGANQPPGDYHGSFAVTVNFQ